MEIRLSKSKILAYLNCPYQFKLQYVNQIPFPTNEYAQRGVDVHDVCNKFFDRLDYDTMNPNKFQGIMKSILNSRYDEFKIFVDNFVEFETKRFNRLPRHHYRPKFKEVKIEFPNLSGIIDRADYEPSMGKFVIWDYKTGTVNSIKPYLFEMAIYAHLFQEKYKRLVAKVGIMCLKNGKIFEREITQDQIIMALKLTDRVREMVKADMFDVNPKANCFFCPQNAKKICSKENKELIIL